MLALTLRAPYDLDCAQVESPTLQGPSEALVRVTRAALCGSDLHPYRGNEAGIDSGTIMGHEFVGEIIEIGSSVTEFRIGQRVFSPFTTCCGSCEFCLSELTCRCSHGQLLGWVEQGSGLQGAQAELVRIPLADSTLLEVPPGLSDQVALLLGDNLSTGYYGAIRAEVQPGRACAVVGCGTVGLLAILCCLEMGADPVYAIDPLPERRTRAQKIGAIALTPEACEEVSSPSVIEAVGNLAAQRLAYKIVAPGGTLASVGVHTSSGFSFTPAEIYDKNLTYRSGRCPARALAPKLISMARNHSDTLAGLFTHTYHLRDGKQAYQLFDKREDGCQKILLDLC